MHAKLTIKEKRDHKRPEMGIVAEALELFNQGGDVVMVCEHLLLVQRRTAVGGVTSENG